MKVNYDRRADVLYLTFADSSEECDYVETSDGTVLRVGIRSGDIYSCTIMWFTKKMEKQQQIVIPGIGALPTATQIKSLSEKGLVEA